MTLVDPSQNNDTEVSCPHDFAGLRAVRSGAVVVMTISGVVTADAWQRLHPRIARIAAAAPASVVDMRGAILDSVFSKWPKSRRCTVRKPVVFVASPFASIEWDDLCRDAADDGYIRSLYGSFLPALTWAHRMAGYRIG
jgi:hypothetical protein